MFCPADAIGTTDVHAGFESWVVRWMGYGSRSLPKALKWSRVRINGIGRVPELGAAHMMKTCIDYRMYVYSSGSPETLTLCVGLCTDRPVEPWRDVFFPAWA